MRSNKRASSIQSSRDAALVRVQLEAKERNRIWRDFLYRRRDELLARSGGDEVPGDDAPSGGMPLAGGEAQLPGQGGEALLRLDHAADPRAAKYPEDSIDSYDWAGPDEPDAF